jgi:hypothetical protein
MPMLAAGTKKLGSWGERVVTCRSPVITYHIDMTGVTFLISSGDADLLFESSHITLLQRCGARCAGPASVMPWCDSGFPACADYVVAFPFFLLVFGDIPCLFCPF